MLAFFSTGIVAQPAAAEGPLDIVTLSTKDFPYVRLYLSARDRSGAPVALKAEDVSVTDSDARVDPSNIQVASAETSPVALVLLVDASARDWIEPLGGLSGFENIQQSGARFLNNFPQGHQLQVVGYDKSLDSSLGFDSTPAGPQGRLGTMTRQPKTWLYDRVDYALDLLNKADKVDRRVLVVVSDGNDVDSDITGQADYAGTLANKARREDASIYAIGAGQDVRERLLRPLAERSGGMYQPASSQQMDQAFRTVTDTLRLQTVVTYLAPCTGRTHNTTVAATSLGAQAVRQYEGGEAPAQLVNVLLSRALPLGLQLHLDDRIHRPGVGRVGGGPVSHQPQLADDQVEVVADLLPDEVLGDLRRERRLPRPDGLGDRVDPLGVIRRIVRLELPDQLALRRIGVDRGRPDQAPVLDHVHQAHIGQPGHSRPGQVLQRLRVVQRGRQDGPGLLPGSSPQSCRKSPMPGRCR